MTRFRMAQTLDLAAALAYPLSAVATADAAAMGSAAELALRSFLKAVTAR
jgi:hypothetical protein